MLHLGLTGGIGSGKSAVARMFAQRGAVVLDADRIARQILEPGQEAARLVGDAFGDDVLDARGGVDRKALAAKVFTDAEARRRLEAIVHPRIVARRREMLLTFRRLYGTGTLVVTEAALIFEADTKGEFDQVMLVTAPVEVRRHRLLAMGWDPAEIERRMAAQWPDSLKIPLARWVIDNGGPEEQTRAQVAALWPTLQELARAAR